MIVYLSIGNSDDKLTQAEWSEFNLRVAAEVASYAATIHGAWDSNPVSPWQNACWCLEFDTAEDVQAARQAATEIRQEFGQQSVAWAVAETEFI
jgi:hypothetical protein